MKLSVNKDLLIKQRFWLLLGLVLPLTIMAIFLLVTSVAEAIAKERSKHETQAAQAQASIPDNQFKSQTQIDKLAAEAAKLKKLEGDIWQKGYDEQKFLYTWPKEIEDVFEFTKGKFAWEIRMEDKGQMPPDDLSKNLIHGRVDKGGKDYFYLTDRSDPKPKVHKIYRTPKVKVTPEGKSFYDVKNTNVAVVFETGKYIGDPLTDTQSDLFSKAYKSQIYGILKQVDPVNAKGEGVVQFKDWVWAENTDPPKGRFFHYFDGTWSLTQDISADVWCKQEDLWIQTEIYRLIRLANDYVSKFKGDGGEKQNVKYTFTNPYWDLTIVWGGGDTLDLEIKNLLPRRQKLDFHIEVRLNKNPNLPPTKLLLPGEPLEPRGFANDSRKIPLPLPKGGPKVTGIYAVEQVLTWDTAAVRRVDNVAFGPIGGNPQGHRIFPEPLKPYPTGAGVGGGEGIGAGAAPAPGDMGDMGTAPPVMAGAGGGGGGDTATDYRYLETTPQLRRMPVAVALIVEQEHVDRVQAAFNNSRLRFLTNQVVINRYPASVRPQITVEQGSPDGKGGRLVQPSSQSASDDLETNVELVIYGIITLYERFPVRVTKREDTAAYLKRKVQPGGKGKGGPAPKQRGPRRRVSVGDELEPNVEAVLFCMKTLDEKTSVPVSRVAPVLMNTEPNSEPPSSGGSEYASNKGGYEGFGAASGFTAKGPADPFL